MIRSVILSGGTVSRSEAVSQSKDPSLAGAACGLARSFIHELDFVLQAPIGVP
jgi:hypothetical protein